MESIHRRLFWGGGIALSYKQGLYSDGRKIMAIIFLELPFSLRNKNEDHLLGVGNGEGLCLRSENTEGWTAQEADPQAGPWDCRAGGREADDPLAMCSHKWRHIRKHSCIISLILFIFIVFVICFCGNPADQVGRNPHVMLALTTQRTSALWLNLDMVLLHPWLWGRSQSVQH